MYKKPVLTLNISDFNHFPIWTWEDEEYPDIVIPIIDFDPIPDDNDAVFVKCNFTLHDGTVMDGVISVQVSDHRVYLLSFPEENGRLLDIPLQILLSEERNINIGKLCKLLNKNLESIFPLKFKTPFKFSDSTLLEGKIKI
jgi:hypothetical protein